MRSLVLGLSFLLGFLFANSSALAAGHAFNENFSVLAEANPSQEQAQVAAEYILDFAEELRKEISIEWLDTELSAGEGRASITLHFQPGEESALTWAKDRADRTLHDVYLRTTPERARQAVEEMLPHEIVHVVLATNFADRLPVWIEEGIASRYDDYARMTIRQETIEWWSQTGNWPQLAELFSAKNLHANDTGGYAAAASLVEYLLTRGDKRTLLTFATDGQARGWNAALQTHYQIHDATRLQSQWQTWIMQSGRIAMHQNASRNSFATINR